MIRLRKGPHKKVKSLANMFGDILDFGVEGPSRRHITHTVNLRRKKLSESRLLADSTLSTIEGIRWHRDFHKKEKLNTP